MATDTRTFGTFADDATVGTITWGTPNAAATSDDTRSIASAMGASAVTHYLKATNSSHSSGSTLASGDTVTQIEYKFEKRKGGNPAANVRDSHVYPVVGGSIVTTTDYASASNWGTSDAVVTYTQTTNLPTADEILASDWGVVLSAYNQNATLGAQAEVDQITAVITFTAAPAFLPRFGTFVRQAVNRSANYCFSFFRSFSREVLAA